MLVLSTTTGADCSPALAFALLSFLFSTCVRFYLRSFGPSCCVAPLLLLSFSLLGHLIGGAVLLRRGLLRLGMAWVAGALVGCFWEGVLLLSLKSAKWPPDGNRQPWTGQPVVGVF